MTSEFCPKNCYMHRVKTWWSFLTYLYTYEVGSKVNERSTLNILLHIFILLKGPFSELNKAFNFMKAINSYAFTCLCVLEIGILIIYFSSAKLFS